MTWIDWTIILLANGAIIAFGFFVSGRRIDRREWFVGNRSLPWYVVGLSVFATSADNSDFVSVAGMTYSEGIHVVTLYTVGSAVSMVLVAFFVVPVMYRAGLYTNAEYLERRFGPATRLISVLVQVQYRTLLMGLMIWSMFLLLRELTDLSSGATWILLGSLALLSWGYTAVGGLRAVVFTDALQCLLILAAAAIVFCSAWAASGGWDSVVEKFDVMAQGENADETSPVTMAQGRLTHIGGYRGASGHTDSWVIGLAWIITACGYWIVNHSQTMRLFGCRSVWDVQMATVMGTGITMAVGVPVAMLGVMGRALEGQLARSDEIYPLLIDRFVTGWGMKGLVVAGIVAAAISTFDSLTSSLSALFTHDVYARWWAPDRSERHYVWVGRLSALGLLVLAFACVPFIASKPLMLQAFRTVISVLVPPLLTIYLVGTLTKAPRRCGLAGIGAGGSYGIVAFLDRELLDAAWLPDWFTGQWPAFGWSVAITAAMCLLLSVGSDRSQHRRPLSIDSVAVDSTQEHPFAGVVPIWAGPRLYAGALVVVAALTFVGLV